ncbi:MAG: hypothetical protein CMA45_01370 [Euryarchaeota archaeon]|nr:hypothetical protein [Euryarchaeota archaeon]|tara:strand:+ start:10 stop:1263 length:1254 start_codon:yes stop_codon:yes gene_type:complete
MGDDDSSSWPDDDDPFSAIEEKADEEEESQESLETKEIEEEAEVEESDVEETVVNIPWSLPIRSAPIMAQTGDIVQEFPLNESPDGLSSTSIVVNENLIRIVEANYGEDGQRRLNVKTVMKQELTGFSHTHNELMHKHQWLWIVAFFVGLGFSFVAQLSMFGQLLLGIGLIGWIYMHLEVHNLEFSTHGSKHKVTFTGYGSNRAMFRASMALIGPTMAKYIETGELDTKSIDDLHESLAKPPEVIPPMPQMAPIQPVIMAPTMTDEEQMVMENVPAPPEANQLPPPAPPEANQLPPPAPPEPVQQNGPPASNTMAPPAPPQPNQLPPPPAPPEVNQLPPPPLAPMNNALPPATLPPPLPPPGAALPPPIGLGLAPIDAGEVPLDAPLPDAPQISVKASPVEESLSPDERNELLEELK